MMRAITRMSPLRTLTPMGWAAITITLIFAAAIIITISGAAG